MISKGFYFSSKIEKNKGDRDFKSILPLLFDIKLMITAINLGKGSSTFNIDKTYY